MPRFLIEVPHDKSTRECNRAIDAFLRTGSHFWTHADWGCKDGDHSAWLIIEVDTKDEARATVPAEWRARARVVRLNHFRIEDVEGSRRIHEA